MMTNTVSASARQDKLDSMSSALNGFEAPRNTQGSISTDSLTPSDSYDKVRAVSSSKFPSLQKRSRNEAGADDFTESQDRPPAKRLPRGTKLKTTSESSHGHRQGSGRPRGAAEPSAEFKSLQAKATAAFLEKSYENALAYAKQAIQINPEIFAAHSLISQIYYEMGLKQESLSVLWSGAHAQREPGVWWEVADRLTELDDKDTPEMLDKLLYCYSAILRLDSKDFDARKAKLDIYMELEQIGKSIRECAAMMKLRPQDLETLQLLADLCLSIGEPRRAIEAYQQAILYYQKCQQEAQSDRFSFSDLNIYLEIFAHTKQWQKGLAELKSLSRWLCGRQKEYFWDSYIHDDREWDIEHSPRRTSVTEFSANDSPCERYGLALPPEIRAKLGIFRLNAGAEYFQEAMRHFRHFDPLGDIRDVNVRDYPDLFHEISDSLFQMSYYTEALKFYEELSRIQHIDVSTRERMGYCYVATSNLNLAVKCYESIFEEYPTNTDICITLAKIQDIKGDWLKASEYTSLAKSLGRTSAVRDAKVNLRGPNRASSTEVSGTSEENDVQRISVVLSSIPKDILRRTRTLNHGRRIYRSALRGRRYSSKLSENSLVSQFKFTQTLLHQMREGDRHALKEWSQRVEQLIEKFRECKTIPPSDLRASEKESSGRPKEDVLTSRVLGEVLTAEATAAFSINPESNIQMYRGIRLSEWLDLLCEYALVKATLNDPSSAYGILDMAAGTEAFSNDPQAMNNIQICTFTCAWILLDEEKICVVARWFMKNYNFKTDTYRLYAAFNRLIPTDPSWYNSGPSQKFVMRQVKLLDFTLLDDESRKEFTFSEQERLTWGSLPSAREDACGESVRRLASLDPALLTLYGNMLATPGSYLNALNYYFRAYAVNPQNALVLLSISLAYLQYSLKRQCENRHYHILQGIAFFEKYKHARLTHCNHGTEPEQQKRDFSEEVVINEGKLWHMLGLTHMAIPAYQNCMSSAISSARTREKHAQGGQIMQATADRRSSQTTAPTFAKEAAFALQSILAMNGDFTTAREVAASSLLF